MLRLAVVTDNQDPDNLRRVRVASADRGVSQSDWISRITGYCDEDLPSPPIGSTVVIGRLEGGSTDEVVIGVLQTLTSNPALSKPDPQSRSEVIYSNGYLGILGEWVAQFKSLVFGTQDPGGGRLALGEISTTLAHGSQSAIQITPTEINITTPMLKWNGERVAVVGGVDSDGDTTLR